MICPHFKTSFGKCGESQLLFVSFQLLPNFSCESILLLPICTPSNNHKRIQLQMLATLFHSLSLSVSHTHTHFYIFLFLRSSTLTHCINHDLFCPMMTLFCTQKEEDFLYGNIQTFKSKCLSDYGS